MTFARTKIQPPRPRAAFVGRGRLQTELADALRSRRLVLLCAPAGYGKTMLLAHELSALGPEVAVAWVSADTGDDLQHLVECMLAAIERYDPPWRTAPESLVGRVAQGSVDEERAVAAEIINTLAACEVGHGVIAFDDLHRVTDPAWFRFLGALIARMSPAWTIAIATRVEPPLPLARLRAADEVAEFRQLHLQFAREEARQLAAAAGLDHEVADRVFDRTQGWPAGLRIAVSAARGGPEHGRAAQGAAAIERALRAGERPLFEFMIEEVLSELRPELADFLLRVSVLPMLDAARCAAVAETPRATALLDEIERLGLFVDVLEGGVHTLRLHDLLRDAMQRHLEMRDPALLAALRRRAAATEPDAMRRATLLLDAGAVDEAAEVVYEHAPSRVAIAGAATPQNLIDAFPEGFRERSPALWFVRALIGWYRWDFASLVSCMERASEGFTAVGDATRSALARAYRAKGLVSLGRLREAGDELAALQALDVPDPTRIIVLSGLIWLAIDTGRLRSVAPLVDEMVTLLADVDRLDLWYHTTPPHRLPGLPGVAGPLARHAALLLRVAGDEPTPLHALALFSQAWCALWQGRLDESRTLRERARDDAAWCGDPAVLRGHFLALGASLAALAGDAAGAMAAARARVDALPAASDWNAYVLVLFAARIASTCSDLPALHEYLPQLDAIDARLADAGIAARSRAQLPVVAQLAWLEGRADAAIGFWEQALAYEEAIDFLGQAVQTRFRLARARCRQRDVAGAARVIEPVFARVRLDGAPGAALFATDALCELAATRWGSELAEDRQAELRGWAAILEAERASPGPAPAGREASDAPGSTRDDLSARELEVLRHLAAGDSNKVIARALDLSLHTVKRHVANILGKVGVATRGQAAAWYRSGPDR